MVPKAAWSLPSFIFSSTTTLVWLVPNPPSWSHCIKWLHDNLSGMPCLLTRHLRPGRSCLCVSDVVQSGLFSTKNNRHASKDRNEYPSNRTERDQGNGDNLWCLCPKIARYPTRATPASLYPLAALDPHAQPAFEHHQAAMLPRLVGKCNCLACVCPRACQKSIAGCRNGRISRQDWGPTASPTSSPFH